MRGKWIFGAASAAMLAAIGFARAASAQEDQTATAAADRPDTGTHARIALGATVNGALTPAGKKDWYRLSARTGMLYRISLNGAPGANSLGDPLLRVVAANGEELGRNDDDSRPRPAPADGAAPSEDQPSNLNSYLEWTPARSGDVFVEARGFDDAATGAYALHVDAVRLPPDPAGASVNTNARINVGQTLSAGLDYAGDKDWYRIRLEQGHSYRFALNAVEGDKGLSDPMLRIMSSTGTELASDDDSGDGLNA